MRLSNPMGSKLVFMTRKREAVTTTVELAELFGKNIKDVNRLATNLKTKRPDVYKKLGIKKDTYIDGSGRTQPKYILSNDAQVFIVMGFTGDDAIDFKVQYIDAFNAMATWISERGGTIDRNKSLQESFTFARTLDGKETAAFHYSNEFKAIGKVFNGVYAKVDRDSLNLDALKYLDEITRYMEKLIITGKPNKERAIMLKEAFPKTWGEL